MRTEQQPGSGVLIGSPYELWAVPVTRLWRRPLCRGGGTAFAASEWEGRSSPAASFAAMDLGGFAFPYSGLVSGRVRQSPSRVGRGPVLLQWRSPEPTLEAGGLRSF